MTAPENAARRTLAELSVPSEPGNERRAMEEVAAAVEGLGLTERDLERLKTAVAEATMNAMEHGNQYRASEPVLLEISVSGARSVGQDHRRGERAADLRRRDARTWRPSWRASRRRAVGGCSS